MNYSKRPMDTVFESGAVASTQVAMPAETQPMENGLEERVSVRSTEETILAMRHWTPTLLSFRTSRAVGFHFTPGHYARLGLGDTEKNAVWRPLSIASAAHEEHLELFVVLGPGGSFSERLAKVRVGDVVRVEKASYGFLTIDHFAPGKDLWLLASGTGLGPFLSILRDPTTWRAFETVVVVHSVRYNAELAYRDEIAAVSLDKRLAASQRRLRYLPVVTRERGSDALSARIPQLIEEGRLEHGAGLELDPHHARIMVCGNPEMARELRHQLTARGFRTNRRGAPGHLAFENYWPPSPS